MAKEHKPSASSWAGNLKPLACQNQNHHSLYQAAALAASLLNHKKRSSGYRQKLIQSKVHSLENMSIYWVRELLCSTWAEALLRIGWVSLSREALKCIMHIYKSYSCKIHCMELTSNYEGSKESKCGKSSTLGAFGWASKTSFRTKIKSLVPHATTWTKR